MKVWSRCWSSQLDIKLVLLLIIIVSTEPSLPAYSKGNRRPILLNSLIMRTTPTGNIPEAPELGTPRYKGQNVGSQWCPL